MQSWLSGFYQFWLNTDDRDVEKYLTLFTHLAKSDVAGIMDQQVKNPAKRPAPDSRHIPSTRD